MDQVSFIVTQVASQFILISYEMWLFLSSRRVGQHCVFSNNRGSARDKKESWENRSLPSLKIIGSPSDPGFLSCFLVCAWGHAKPMDLRRENVRNCSASPPVSPWLSPHYRFHRPPHPALAQLLASPSTSLSSDFWTLGHCFWLTSLRKGSKLSDVLYSPLILPSYPFLQQTIYFCPGLDLDSPTRRRDKGKESG